jgi:hypothetical protein
MDALDAIAGRLPLGLNSTIQGVIRGTQQRQATNVAPGLLQQQPASLGLQSLGVPAVYGGLLAAQPVNNP